MEMSLQEIITLVIESLIIPLLLWGVAELRRFLLAKVKSTQVLTAIELANTAVEAAVGEAGQVFVDTLKEQGLFTQEAAQQAFNGALARAREILGAGGEKLLKQAVGDVQAYLAAKIEETVRATKQITYELDCECAKEEQQDEAEAEPELDYGVTD